MADVVITLTIMPDSPDVDLKQVESLALDKVKSFSGMENYKVELEPVAFGLKAVKILFYFPFNYRNNAISWLKP